MVEILIELTLAAARDDFQGDLTPALRDAIFAHYGIDSVRFHEAVDYYADHPDAYAELYTTVLDRLSAERVRNSDPAPPSLPPGATPVLPPE